MRLVTNFVRPITEKTGSQSIQKTEEPKNTHSVSFTSDECLGLLRRCFVCLSQGLEYLHRLGIRHGDIKPANILVDESGSVLFTGFSNSSTQDDQTYRVDAFTHRYAAPEVAYFATAIQSSDVYSLGCIFLEIATLLSEREVPSFRYNSLPY